MTTSKNTNKGLEILKKNTKPISPENLDKIIESNYGGYKDNVGLDDKLSKDKAQEIIKKK